MEQTDAAAGQWLAEALERYLNKERWDAWAGTVASTIPDNFECYARILHRVNGSHAPEVRWADIARDKGTLVHPKVQFHTMARTALYERVVLGGVEHAPPSPGELDEAQLAALGDILTGQSESDIYQAVWNGWGGFEPGTTEGIPYSQDGTLEVAKGFRAYFVFRGTGEDFGRPPWFDAGMGLNTQSPNLAWPEDRSWCVATEVDFDSTLVGGSAELIAAVVQSSILEAVQVTPATKLTSDADALNSPPR